MAIITAAEYKTWFGISATTWDAQLAVIIPAIQDAIEVWTGRRFDTATYTEKHDGGGSCLILRNYPIASVTSVTYRGETTAVDSTTYAFSTTGSGKLWLLSDSYGWDSGADYPGVPSYPNGPTFPRGREQVTVVYVGGYATMPPGLKMIMYELCQRMLAKAVIGGGADPDLKSENLGNYSYTRMTPSELATVAANTLAIGTDVQQMLNGYRRMVDA